MKLKLQHIFLVIRREFLDLRSPRSWLPLVLFAALQFLISAVNKSHGRVEDTVLIFQIGGILTIILAFDLIAKERENHTIDLQLTQGISRNGLFIAKWCAMVAFCLLGGLAYIIGNGLGMLIQRVPIQITDLLAESGMIAWLLSVYGSIALLFSVLFRRAKMALAGSVVVWLLFRPPVLSLLIFNPLQQVFDWSKNQLWQVLALMPEFAFRIGLEPARAIPNDVSIRAVWSFLALSAYVILLGFAAGGVFANQDETM